SFPRTGLQMAPKGFQRPRAGCTDSHHTTAVLPAAQDCLDRVAWNRTPLRVDLVVLREFDRHRPEGVQPDMERHEGNVDPVMAEAVDNVLREMKSGRRRCGRASLMTEDGLVPLPVLQLGGDVRRQRDGAIIVEIR